MMIGNRKQKMADMRRTSKTEAICVAVVVFIGMGFAPVSGQQAAPQAGGPPQQGAGGRGRGPQGPPPIDPKPEELARVREKTEQIEKLVGELKAKHADPVLLNDVEVYAKAGRMLLEPLVDATKVEPPLQDPYQEVGLMVSLSAGWLDVVRCTVMR
jgi:hypothetical protein